MEQQLFKLAAGNGIWSALFVFLFLYVLYDSKKRESKYQETIKENQDIIKELSQKFGIVEDIQNDVTCIKDELKNK
ncbi:bacteriocin [Acidilutibacter cellobiosedens]|uniref:Bacteriocin n=1 Tax=Acidilutibacter cellobiosedens TaxID=2507161 RepID=A0A410QDY5_9FIRM|nr:BhlA/UviB family holin-like peptide [Acidilutibacter cellobiosedens]MBE6081287.1 bacteriocin [Tissierellaceae bacterium]QAT62186.1 bacteriocin [Acidilutibacter cellobiosedens]